MALRGYSNIACYYRYDLLSSGNLLRWGADERRFHSFYADHGSSRPMSHRAGGVPVGGRATSLLQILCRNRRHGRKTAARQGVVCRERSATGRRRGRYRPGGEPCRGRETAGADLYISSISEPGCGGLIPESTEFGSPGGGASNLSLLPPSGAANRPCWRYS